METYCHSEGGLVGVYYWYGMETGFWNIVARNTATGEDLTKVHYEQETGVIKWIIDYLLKVGREAIKG